MVALLMGRTVHQHQTWTNNLCFHRWLGICSLGDTSQVSLQCSKFSYNTDSGPAFTTVPRSSAQGFLNFMSGYTVFLGPFAGIMVTDVRFKFHPRSITIHLIVLQFWLVHGGKVDVPAMYDPNGRYRYTKGIVSYTRFTFFAPMSDHLKELAGCSCHPCDCWTNLAWSYQYYQHSCQRGPWDASL